MVYTISLNPSIDRTIYLDRFQYGALNRVKDCRRDVGGKGINVSKVLNTFRIENTAVVVHAGKTGADIVNGCRSIGIATVCFEAQGESRENLKIIDSKTNITTEVNERGPVIGEHTLRQIETQILSRLTPEDYVVLTGSLPASVPATLYYDWTEIASAKGAKVILDADGEPLKHGLRSRLYAIKPNLHELEVYTGHEIRSVEEITSCGKELAAKGIGKIVVSLGADGAVFFLNGNIYKSEAMKVTVKSTVGAGDSMLAALIYTDLNGFNDDAVIRYTVAAATAAITKEGTEQPDIGLIESLKDQVVYCRL